MEKITLILSILLITIFSCKKTEPPIVPGNPVETTQAGIRVFFNNDTIQFRPVRCLNDENFVSSLISMAASKDSFGINRRTIISTADNMACEANDLQLGIDIIDKIENYPVTREVMKMHLEQIQSKTATLSRFEVNFTDDCTTFQNFQRIFNDSVQLYTFSKNENFNYEIDDYSIIDGAECGYNADYFLVELEGSFKGVLYTTPNVVNRDSIFVECPKFKVRILHSINN